MAFTAVLTTQSSQPFPAYNVDWAVGRIGSNARDDVMLVQALLRIFYYELMGFTDVGFEPPPNATDPIAVDGRIGPITQSHIVHFQSQIAAKGSPTTQDGIFDPFRGPGQLSTITHSRYSLDALNSGCNHFCNKQGIDNYRNLPNRQDVPAALRAALRTHKSTAAQYTYVPQTVPTTGGA
ncbi:MAG: peptidoglycan-binding protein [Proteobacteria bacterium]|nr:peptidoglycan-binding protein [Pseudomonadota bacterium]